MKRLLLLICFFLLASPVWATTYYVNKAGSDANSCATAQSATDANAKLTIAGGSGGISCLAAGDTLLIGNGTYAEKINNTIPAGSSGSVLTTIRAENEPSIGSKGEITALVILRPTSGSDVIVNTHAYVKIHGLEIDASSADGLPINGYNGSVPFLGNVIEYNRIHGGNNGGSPGGESGILGDFSESTFAHNEIDNNGDGASNSEHGIYSPGPGNIIEYNYIHDTESYGLHIYPSADNNIIRYNRIQTSEQRGILISGSGNQFYNNIEDGDNWGLTVEGSNNLIYNNTFYNNGHGAGGDGRQCVIVTAGSGNIGRNNICYLNEINSIVEAGGTITQDHNLTGSNPAFTNASGHDFTLTSSSTAVIDQGVDLSALFGDDFTGLTRPVGSAWDIGVYEFNGGGGGGASCSATSTFDGSEDPLSESGRWSPAGWTEGTGITKVTGFAQAKATGDSPAVVCTGDALPADQYQTLTLNVNTSASWSLYSYIRINASGSTQNGYRVRLQNTGAWDLKREDNSIATTLASGSATISSTVTLRVEVIGSALRTILNGVEISNVTDSTYSGTGSTVGFVINVSSALTDLKIDQWEAGSSTGGGAGGTITVITPLISSVQQRPANVSTSWTTDLTSGTVSLTYSFDNFITSYLIATGVTYNASPFVFTPSWPTQDSMNVRICQGAVCGDSPTFVTRGEYLK